MTSPGEAVRRSGPRAASAATRRRGQRRAGPGGAAPSRAEPPPPRSAAPGRAKMEPRFDVSPRGGRRAARRGGGEGKVSRQPGAAPPHPPAPGAPRGFCRARPPTGAPRNAPARPGLAPAPARRAGAGALQRRAPRSRRPPEPSPATLCGRNRGCRLGSSGGRTAKGLCGGKRREEGKGWGKPLSRPQTSTTHLSSLSFYLGDSSQCSSVGIMFGKQ